MGSHKTLHVQVTSMQDDQRIIIMPTICSTTITIKPDKSRMQSHILDHTS
ncbi:hypothetical protein Sjap_006251 [Stephania japonica]|uniref:Uncharacterized protein n=1 Tax=Stephania japonica TaxID=461633 RepID=A0AAP0PIQ8_9MAGN